MSKASFFKIFIQKNGNVQLQGLPDSLKARKASNYLQGSQTRTQTTKRLRPGDGIMGYFPSRLLLHPQDFIITGDYS